MQSSNQLQDMLHSINRKSYPAYKSLKGAYQFKKYVLSIDHVQGDPFASPSHISVKIFHREAGFPAEYYKDKLTRITLADYLTRQFEQQVNRYTFRAKGSGKSGLISVTRCGQEVLEREDAAKEELTAEGVTFVDVDNAQEEQQVAQLIKRLEDVCLEYRLLGRYPAAKLTHG